MTKHTVSAAMLLMAAGLAQAQAEYELHIIPALSIFGIPEAYLFDVNDQGRAVGFMTVTIDLPGGSLSTQYRGYSWSVVGGPVVDFDAASFTDINNHNDMLGQGFIRIADGSTIGIPPVDGDRFVHTNAINDNLTVGGASVLSSSSGCSFARNGMYWTPATGPVLLTAFIGSAELVSAINQQDQAVGHWSLSGACTDNKGFFYDIPNAEHIDLNFLLNGDSGNSEPLDINEQGVVVGDGWNGTQWRAWSWQRDTGFTFLEGLHPSHLDRAKPRSVNNDGAIVGQAYDGAAWTAAIWTPDGHATNLNDLVPSSEGFILDNATAINNRGDIVGYGHFGPGFGLGVAFYLEAKTTTCRPDIDGDGQLTIFDFLEFQNAFAAQDPIADFDGDGQFTLFDFLEFQNAFAAGCG